MNQRKSIYSRQLIFLLLVTGIFLKSCNLLNENQNKMAGEDWPVYLGEQSSSQYSMLSSINKSNVKNLTPVWEYHTGDDISENRSQIQCNPIIINGILYGTSPKLKVFALDAATGEEIWVFDPDTTTKYAKNVNRGVSYWKDGSDSRILFSSGSDLFALNSKTGQPIESFGVNGIVSLKEGLGENAEDLYVVATSPGVVYNDLLVIGSRVSENSGAAPGFIRAFNIRNGKLEWVFKTIPYPGEFGYETWPDSAYLTAGGVNSWSGMSLDTERGIIYIPTGSAAFDFWGGNRKGANLFANCILALNAQTGEYVWHFQTVHHDLWDRDLPAPPNLLTVNHEGGKVDAVAQITKSGFVFLLDRETGEPLFPVDEKPVPKSDLIGEETWPTQPIPQLPPPFVPQSFNEEDITNISQESHDYVKSILSATRTGERFIPPSTQGTMIFPGFDGGGEWGGAAVDPENSVLYVNSNIMPWILTMVDINQKNNLNKGLGARTYQVNCAVCHGAELQGNQAASYPSLKSVSKKYTTDEILTLINTGKGFMPSFKHLSEKDKDAVISFLVSNISSDRLTIQETMDTVNSVPYTHTGYNRFFDQNGYPAVKPPWGTISAIDLNEGTIKWQIPLGEFPELTSKGIPQTGTENYGGPVVTDGGLLFIGASKDGYFRAFDKDSGEELWKYKLPAGGYATPSTYSVNGKQYVVIACGGGKMGTHSGDSYVAFSLNDD